MAWTRGTGGGFYYEVIINLVASLAVYHEATDDYFGSKTPRMQLTSKSVWRVSEGLATNMRVMQITPNYACTNILLAEKHVKRANTLLSQNNNSTLQLLPVVEAILPLPLTNKHGHSLCPARPLSRVDGRDTAHAQREPPRVASLRGRGALPRTHGVARSRLRVLFRQQPATGTLDQRPGVRRTQGKGSRVLHALSC